MEERIIENGVSMRCVNCGQEYVGNFCDMCGTPAAPAAMPQQTVQQTVIQQQPVMQQQQIQQSVVNGNDVGTLCINRPNLFIGCLIDIELTVDGYPYKLSNGGQLLFNLTPGPHVITYKVWCRRVQTINVFVQPRFNYLIDFKYDWIWGGFKLSDKSILQ